MSVRFVLGVNKGITNFLLSDKNVFHSVIGKFNKTVNSLSTLVLCKHCCGESNIKMRTQTKLSHSLINA